MNLTVSIKGGSLWAILKHLITVQKHLLSGTTELQKDNYIFTLEETVQWRS